MLDNWEKNLGVLYIEGKIPLTDFIEGNSTKDKIVAKMKEKNLYNAEMEKEINELFDELHNGNLIPVLSGHTPISGKFGRKFNLIFDRNDLDKTEETEVTIKYGIMYQTFFLQEFPEGHSCVPFVQEDKESNLIKGLPYHLDPNFRIGFCDKTNWPRIKQGLIDSKREYEEWKNENNKK